MSSRALTPANQITILRLVFVPLFVFLEIESEFGWALAVLGAAALSDAVDGIVARLFHQESPIGIALDPIADKILMATAFLILSIRAALPWWLTVLVLGRDVAIVLLASLISLVGGYRPFRPTLLGKTSTVFQVAAVVAAVMNQASLSVLSPFAFRALLYATFALTLASGAHYLLVVRHRYEPSSPAGTQPADKS